MSPRPRPDTSCQETPYCPYIVEIRDNFRSLDGRLSFLNNSQTRIEQAIVGDKTVGLKGLVERQADIVARQDSIDKVLERLDHRLIYWGGFIGGISLIGTYFLQKILS
jgi:hypothetical protein